MSHSEEYIGIITEFHKRSFKLKRPWYVCITPQSQLVKRSILMLEAVTMVVLACIYVVSFSVFLGKRNHHRWNIDIQTWHTDAYNIIYNYYIQYTHIQALVVLRFPLLIHVHWVGRIEQLLRMSWHLIWIQQARRGKCWKQRQEDMRGLGGWLWTLGLSSWWTWSSMHMIAPCIQ